MNALEPEHTHWPGLIRSGTVQCTGFEFLDLSKQVSKNIEAKDTGTNVDRPNM
jgi:hypothetical protein